VFADEDLIPISALQHHLFCPRQCALIHVDGLWAENRLTAEGRVLHERSDTPGRRTRRPGDLQESNPDMPRPAGIRTVRALPLLCRRLGLSGRADQVELPLGPGGDLIGPPRPVEHKRGSPKRLDHDRVQVAAQALCLEEMFGVPVPEGELFYHAVRRRERVAIDDKLRALVERITAEVRANIVANLVPRAEKQKKCQRCSLLNLCMPGATGPNRSPSLYITRSLAISVQDRPDSSGDDA
jgi:CRISPR-associated exonuclease Cas4